MAHVPDLDAKIRLLLRKGPTRDKKALAEKLDVAISTLNGWSTGNKKSPPDWVPKNRLTILVQLFARSLPQSVTLDQVESLLTGRVAALEAAYAESGDVSLEEILAQEAKLDTTFIHRASSLALVERSDRKSSVPSVKLHEDFMLEFRIGHGGYLLAVQNAQQAWGVVTFADGTVSPKHKAGQVLLPGIERSQILYINETSSVGAHRFMLFVSPEPYPVQVTMAALSGKSLDWPMLGDLARHFNDQPRHLRELHLFHLNVERTL